MERENELPLAQTIDVKLSYLDTRLPNPALQREVKLQGRVAAICQKGKTLLSMYDRLVELI